MNNTILLLIFTMTIIIGTCLNVKIENFEQEKKDSKNKITEDKDSSKSPNEININDSKINDLDEMKKLPDNIKINTSNNNMKRDMRPNMKPDMKRDMRPNMKPDMKQNKMKEPVKNKEPYYDYKYTINNNRSPESECKQQPININLNYPVPPQDNTKDIEYREPPYNTSLLKNLAGTPADQVQTSYSVLDNDMYKSWDNYYLPGYSYFPPSTWQLPIDNRFMIPKDLDTGKCDVCPLSQTNDYGNFLSGDYLSQGSTNLPPIPNLPDTTKIVEKKIVTRKIKKT